MHPQSASLFDFDFYEPLPIRVKVSDAPLTSDAGLLPLRQFDQRIGLTAQFAAALHDPRDPARSRPHRPHLPGDGPFTRVRHPRRLRGSKRP
jgi:hypothetical protein